MLFKKDFFIERYTAEVKRIWLSTSDEFPDFLPVISEEKKELNKAYLQSVIANIQEHANSFSRLPHKRKKWKSKLLAMINDVIFHEDIIGIHKNLDTPSLKALYDELMIFLRQARHFSPELGLDEIGQAIRNYIVYAMFKLMHQDESGFNLAAFGYSMLYPITDNYIDNKLHSPEQKQEYNRLIHDKLSGRYVYPLTKHQKKTCALLSAIENKYPRSSCSEIYQLLLMMLDAQKESLRQQNSDEFLSEDERLNISLYKGGISVLIDRYLVNQPLNDKDILTYLKFGFFLQLADDLQDIGTDGRQGYQTILTLQTTQADREKIINKLLHFIHNSLTEFKCENETFKDFVLSNCYMLILTSVIESREFFSDKYIRQIEKHLPVKSDYLAEYKISQNISLDKKAEKKYLNMLDVVISK